MLLLCFVVCVVVNAVDVVAVFFIVVDYDVIYGVFVVLCLHVLLLLLLLFTMRVLPFT